MADIDSSRWETVCIGMGSNLGDSRTILKQAYRELAMVEGVRAVRLSGPYVTEPVDMVSVNRFINAAALIRTILEPHELLKRLLHIEYAAGRRRTGLPGYQDRTLDLDILLYAGLMVRTRSLEIPHPRLLERLFVLQPLAEVAPGFVHPVTGKTILEHLRTHPDHGDSGLVSKTEWDENG